MTGPDRRDRADSSTDAPAVTSLRGDEPMTDELCLFVLTLVADGRGVSPQLVERARAHAVANPVCARQLDDLQRIGAVLASEPARHAPQGFAERVVAAAREEQAPGAVLPMLRQVAVAAALVLAVSLVWVTSRPGQLVADDHIDAQAHAVDHFRAEPYRADDLDAGLESLLPDPRPRASVPEAGR